MNINQLKLKVHDRYKKEEKLTTNFQPTDDVDDLNKSYLDEKLKKTVRIHIEKKITTNLNLNYKATNNL